MWGKSRVHSRLFLNILVFLSLGIFPGAPLAADLHGHLNGHPTSETTVPIHLPYPMAFSAVLTEVDGQLLARDAAEAFNAMQRAARQEGVRVVLRSGYRSHSRQSWLFYGVAAARGITLAERAKVSAPPGYSEHHTGYALDLDDGDNPQPLRQSFERTRAGQWLIANAHRFCFEMSFPRGNAQGISYEPWHWRYVGSTHATQTFALAHARYPGVASDILRQVSGGEGRIRNCTGLPIETARAEAQHLEAGDCASDRNCAAQFDQVADASRIADSARR